MNKEERDEILNGITGKAVDYICCLMQSYEELEQGIEELQQENKQLKEQIEELRADYGNKSQVERDLLQLRIDKAIGWIDWFRKDNKEFYKNKIGLTMAELDGLENILKGDSNGSIK